MSNCSSNLQFFDLLNLYRSAEFAKLQNENGTNESILLTCVPSFTKPTDLQTRIKTITSMNT